MKTVVLVEDDRNIALAFGVRLKAMGYRVHVAQDAAQAVSVVRKVTPDVVLLDISLPAGDGFLVAERLRTIDGLAAIPIIFITASKRPGLQQRAKTLGAIGFLEKPFEAADLANAIEYAMLPEAHWEPRVESAIG